MIEFKLKNVISGWWHVSVGRSLDDIEYEIYIDGECYRGGHYKLDHFLKLFECVSLGVSSESHPFGGGYSVSVSGSYAYLDISGEQKKLHRDEVRDALEAFLTEIFTELNEMSTEDKKKAAANFYSGRDEYIFSGKDLFNYFQKKTPPQDRITIENAEH